MKIDPLNEFSAPPTNVTLRFTWASPTSASASTVNDGSFRPYFTSAASSGDSSAMYLNFDCCSWLITPSTAILSTFAVTGVVIFQSFPGSRSRVVVSSFDVILRRVSSIVTVAPSVFFSSAFAGENSRSLTSFTFASCVSFSNTPFHA